VASRLATWDEVCALVNLVGRESEAIFQLTSEPASFSEDLEVRNEYFGRLQDLAVASGVPIVFGLFAMANGANTLPLMEETTALGGKMYGLTNCRGVSVLLSFRTRLPFDKLPEWQEVRSRPLEEQRTLLQDPDVRARLVHAAHHGNYGNPIGAEARKPDWNLIRVLESTYLPNPSVGELAAARGVDPVEFMIDISLETDFQVFFQQALGSGQPEEPLMRILRSPLGAMTFSDAGAHVSQILDASIQTHLLAYWVRERQMLSLEEAIPMITRQPAKLWNLHDRGQLLPGYAADITVFDPDAVAPEMPEVVTDLPGGSRRLIGKAQGYKATVVNGEVLIRDGEPTDARSGQLLRGGRLSVG